MIKNSCRNHYLERAMIITYSYWTLKDIATFFHVPYAFAKDKVSNVVCEKRKFCKALYKKDAVFNAFETTYEEECKKDAINRRDIIKPS